MADEKTMLVTKNLSVGYADSESSRVVFSSLNIHAHAGELVALAGRNGVGKSTLLRTLAGLQPPVDGEVLVKGRNIGNFKRNERARTVTLVPSEATLVPNLTIRSFVAMGRYPYIGWGNSLTSHDWSMVDRALADVGISRLQQRDMATVSDGERHRAMIAFALAQDTEIILLDEPTAFLDLPNKFETVRLLAQLAQSRMKLIVYSTHDLQVALNEADSMWLMNTASFVAGVPEDLALSREFDRLFENSSVCFDPHAGIFRNQRAALRPINLAGNGDSLVWTRHMLHRLGYYPSDASTLKLLCIPGNIWQLSRNEILIAEVESLSDLARLLKQEAE